MAKLILLLMFLFLMGGVYAITCSYDGTPYVTDDIDWSCELSSPSKCYGAIFYNGSLISVSPKIKDLRDIGRIEYFESKGNLINMKFRRKDLYEGIEYNFSVYCVSNSSIEVYSDLIVPYYKEMRWMVYRGVFVKENMPYIFAFVLLIMFFVPIIWFIKAK